MSEVKLFADAFAETSRLDGIVFKFDCQGYDHRQLVVARLLELVQKHVKLDEKEHKRCFKVGLFYMDTDRYRAIVKVHLYGGYLKAVSKLPAALIAHLFEAHFKSYIYNQDEQAFKLFAGRAQWAQGGRQPSTFGDKNNPNSKKGAGWGMRIGDRNSDYHFVFYKRKAQRIGLELRIKDKACWRRAMSGLDAGTKFGLLDATVWEGVLNSLRLATAEEFVRDIKSKHENLSWTGGLTDVHEESLDGPVVQFRFDTGADDEVKTWVALPII